MPADGIAPVLALMAKAPVPGQSKTRLMPDLSASEAADVAAALIRETARLAGRAWPGPIHLFCWPDQNNRAFREIVEHSRIETANQSGGNLGEKMSNAICGFTSRGIPAAVMGCDIPHCPPDQLLHAFNLLEEGKNVIGPGVDGGYYFLGLQDCLPDLFAGIRWGGADVLQWTMKNADRLGIELTALDSLQDIDSYADLVAAASEFPDLQRWLKQDHE